MNTRENSRAGSKAGTISTGSLMKALAAVCLRFCHERRDTNPNNQQKPAVPQHHTARPQTHWLTSVANQLCTAQTFLFQNFQLFHSRSALTAPFWGTAKAAWFWQPGRDVIRLKVFNNIVLVAYKRILCLRNQSSLGSSNAGDKAAPGEAEGPSLCIQAQLTEQPGKEKGYSSTRNEIEAAPKRFKKPTFVFQVHKNRRKGTG